MCIALFSTAHPKYALVVASNRDEYLHRPTAPAAWWDAPHSHVLGGRDLQREVKGTWLGVTADGRIAVLTNFREDGDGQGMVSRGAMVNAYLTQEPGKAEDTETFARELVTGEGARGSGGFTLVCGRMGEPLAVVSNRMNLEDVAWIAKEKGETVGLSNATFGDRTWPKVIEGEDLLQQSLEKDMEYQHGEEQLIENIFTLLTRDTLPKRQDGQDWSIYVKELRNSIFIPVTGGDDSGHHGDEIATARSGRRMSVNKLGPGAYGTTKQTVILVEHNGKVTFIEKTLYEEGIDVSADSASTRRYEYMMERPKV